MKLRIVSPPALVRWYYPDITWHKDRSQPRIFLTFDDGPIPDVTPEVLKILKKEDIKATFFCVGENIVKHPDLFEQIKAGGHHIGNHTYNHLNGSKTPEKEYLENVAQCQSLVHSHLFRPPYARISKNQLRQLKPHYEVVIADVITYDFDQSLSPEACYENAIKYAKNGSIIVFHDNIKARQNMLYALPKAIGHWKSKGFGFGLL
ncbi:polysaccharide deacetylase family protein [Olivibacter sitiensis]|uniref:polysaccharide deacetylase family protein n=1 Tax=Olivibacter sitiensis TaxID=376470 RepID=UPI00040C9188|nr:polysaccharide deacetylase family protein [Olivibacter sitiensis]